jgi:hypothetical protein
MIENREILVSRLRRLTTPEQNKRRKLSLNRQRNRIPVKPRVEHGFAVEIPWIEQPVSVSFLEKSARFEQRRRLGIPMKRGDVRAIRVVSIWPQDDPVRGRPRIILCQDQVSLVDHLREVLLLRELAVHGRWWGGRLWAQIQARMPAWVIQQLEVWKEVLEMLEAKARAVEVKLEAAAAAGLFHGQGKLTSELLRRELLDPQRFRNGRSVGNYFGLCPSESSSGETRRLGSITKRGNPRLRHLMVELAWRVVRFQPDYRGVKKWRGALASRAPAQRKKAIVALARRLAVDLWRIALGRVQAAELGLRGAIC